MMSYQALIIGVDSYVGSRLMAALRARGTRVLGTTRRPAMGWGTVRFDLREPTELPVADVAYFCAALTRVRECAEFPELARQVNVVGPAIAAKQLVDAGGRVVMLSSSAAETLPECSYGELKLEGERNFLSHGDKAAVFRFGPLMKPGRNPYPDKDYQPLPAEDVVEALVRIGINWKPGIHAIKQPSKVAA